MIAIRPTLKCFSKYARYKQKKIIGKNVNSVMVGVVRESNSNILLLNN